MSKNIAETEGPQMTSEYGAYARYVLDKKGYMHACTHTLTNK
jgi:hypothetical protein